MSNKRIGQSSTPTMSEVLETVIAQAMSKLFVAMPGKVEKYVSATQTADIKPLLRETVIDEDGEEDVESLPIIPSVPVVFPRTSEFFLSFPLNKGDNVLLLFCDKSIDNYMNSSGQVDLDPVDLRQHHISDAVAIPGFFPTAKIITDVIEGDTVLGKQRGAQVRCKGSTVEITSGGLPASVVGFVAMAAKIDALWLALTVALDAFVAAAPHTPDGGVALATALSTAIKLVPSYQNTSSTNLKAD